MNVLAHLSMKMCVTFFYPLIKLIGYFDENKCSRQSKHGCIAQETFLLPLFVFVAETIETLFSLALKGVR